MLAICVPTRDSVTSSFSFSLAQLTASLARESISFMLFFEEGSVLVDQRNRLITRAIKNSCVEILMLDSDMEFPSTIYESLRKHNLDIVACTYSTRVSPYHSVAFVDETDWSKRLAESSGVHEVAAVGLGCMLVKSKIFEDIYKPWFSFQYDYNYDCYRGEDITFCKAVRRAGYTVSVDVDTSKTISHTGQVKLFLR